MDYGRRWKCLIWRMLVVFAVFMGLTEAYINEDDMRGMCLHIYVCSDIIIYLRFCLLLRFQCIILAFCCFLFVYYFYC